MNNKEKFLKIYASLPLGIRGDIILVLKDLGPISWNAAYLEVNNDTNLSEIILDKLASLEII